MSSDQNPFAQRRLDIFLLCLVVAAFASYEALNRDTGNLHSLRLPLDNELPLVPAMALPYLLFLPVFAGVILRAFARGPEFRWLATTVVLTFVISDLFFALYQTVVIRPAVNGDSIWDALLRFVYSSDQPFNGFPSTHASSATVMVVYFAITARSWTGRAIPSVFAIVVVVSTLLVKQHYLLDAIGGIVLALVVSCLTRIVVNWRKRRAPRN